MGFKIDGETQRVVTERVVNTNEQYNYLRRTKEEQL